MSERCRVEVQIRMDSIQVDLPSNIAERRSWLRVHCLQTSLDNVETVKTPFNKNLVIHIQTSYGYGMIALRLPATPPARSVCIISVE